MFSKEMENLIEATLQDGVLTDQEKAVLVKRAEKEGVDIDELDVYIQSIMQKRHQEEAAAEAEKDRESKMGTVKKCPNCGQPVQSGWAVCPACGFAFNNEKLNSTATELQKKLNKIDDEFKQIIESRVKAANERKANKSAVANFLDTEFDDDDSYVNCDVAPRRSNQKKQAIENTVIPNSRGDLLELLAFCKPKANPKGPKSCMTQSYNENLSYAYWILYGNCIELAKISFATDNSFIPFFNHYDELSKKKGFFARLFGK